MEKKAKQALHCCIWRRRDAQRRNDGGGATTASAATRHAGAPAPRPASAKRAARALARGPRRRRRRGARGGVGRALAGRARRFRKDALSRGGGPRPQRCVDVLLDGGADPETPSGHRSRPLAYAAFRGDAALCARLLGAGADPNKKAADGADPSGRRRDACSTAYARSPRARGGAADVVRLLLARGASRDARTGTGRTALVVATAFGELQTVRALLRAGARPDLNLLAMDPAEAEASLFPLLQDGPVRDRSARAFEEVPRRSGPCALPARGGDT